MEHFSEHFSKEHFLGRIDARVKLLSGMLLLLMVLSHEGIAFPFLVASLCLWLCIRMRVTLRAFFLRFAQPMFIAVMIVLLKFLFTGENVVFSMKVLGIGIAGHSDGLMEGILIASRIVGAVSIVTVLGFATPFDEIVAALSWFRVPRGLIEVMIFAYRYIFVLLEDALVIYNAQKNRLGYSSVRRGLRSFGVLAGSLTLRAFENSQHTATAMLQRGYDGDMPLFKHKGFRLPEVAAAFVFLTIMGVVSRLW
jgi:cobalt/nickel transport system permease protein